MTMPPVDASSVSSFYRTELRLLRQMCATDDEFFTRVAQILDTKDRVIDGHIAVIADLSRNKDE